MIALETNIIIRLIAGDDHAQERAVLRLLAEPSAIFFISDVTLAESAWVLGSLYGFSREELVADIEALASRTDLVFEDRVRVRRAITHLQAGGDLTDLLILARAQAASCSALASFDKGLKKKFPDFVLGPK